MYWIFFSLIDQVIPQENRDSNRSFLLLEGKTKEEVGEKRELWREWNEDGQLSREYDYDKNGRKKTAKTWNENGEVEVWKF